MFSGATITRKDQISLVAQNKFRQRGYAATSMRDMASEIGIEPASLYSHFKSKEEILKEICFGIADEFFREIAVVENSKAPADEKLNLAISIHVNVIKQNADAFAVFLHDWRYLNEPNLSNFKALRKKYENIFREIIKEGMQKGIFKDINEKFAVLTLFGSLNWIYVWYKPSGDMTPKEIADNLGNLVLNGFRSED